jgi:hypothetical protein
MDVNYLKRSCESLLESSKDLLGDQTNIEALKKTRLYAIQVVDLLEEKEDSFIDMLFKLTGGPEAICTSIKELMDWVNVYIRITWYDENLGRGLYLIVASKEVHDLTFVPMLKYLGFSSMFITNPGKMIMIIKPLKDAKIDSIARRYMNHEYGDYNITHVRFDLYSAFMYRQLKPRMKIDLNDVCLKEERDVFLSTLRTTIWRDLGLFLDVQTLKCTADEERLGKMLIDRLL